MGCSCIPRAGREGPETPLPKFRVFVLLCITVSEGFSLNMLFPFVSYMVRSFGYTSAADVGRHAAVCVCVCWRAWRAFTRRVWQTSFYAAFVGSAFGFAQFLGSFYWGVLSDRYGRRPVLLLGLIGSAFSMVLFGFSTSLSMAIASRALNGLLNGNSGGELAWLCCRMVNAWLVVTPSLVRCCSGQDIHARDHGRNQPSPSIRAVRDGVGCRQVG